MLQDGWVDHVTDRSEADNARSEPADVADNARGDSAGVADSDPDGAERDRPVVPRTANPVGRIGERSPKDMLLSLLVLLLPIALLLAFNRFVLDGEQPTLVDPGPAVAQARSAGVFPVDHPVGLDPAWRPVRADFRREADGATLRIGYLAPGDAGVQLVQSDIPAERLLPAELTGAGRPEGTVDIAGTAWQRYPARPGERALVLLEPERSVIVVGSAEESRLRELAGALRSG